MAGFAVAISFLIFNINEFLEYFYRVERVIPKLEYRLEKVSRIAELMCQSVGCHLFGTGPGSHTYFNRGILGETAMLAVEQQALHLRQRPLIVMECSVIADRYLGLGYSDEALELMQHYQQTCYRVGGQFGLLWHNSHFGHEGDSRFYQALVEL